jgi:hypothetical protein
MTATDCGVRWPDDTDLGCNWREMEGAKTRYPGHVTPDLARLESSPVDGWH